MAEGSELIDGRSGRWRGPTAQEVLGSRTVEELTPATTKAFTERFCGFGDGLLRSICLNYIDGTLKLVVELDAFEIDSAKSEHVWSRLRLEVSGVVEYRFAEAPVTAMYVLTNGLHLCWFGEEEVGLELGDFADAPETREDISTSNVFAVGSLLHWEMVQAL
jgi:hypothetical protein